MYSEGSWRIVLSPAMKCKELVQSCTTTPIVGRTAETDGPSPRSRRLEPETRHSTGRRRLHSGRGGLMVAAHWLAEPARLRLDRPGSRRPGAGNPGRPGPEPPEARQAKSAARAISGVKPHSRVVQNRMCFKISDVYEALEPIALQD